jgi:DNA polymerase-3 subunit delta
MAESSKKRTRPEEALARLARSPLSSLYLFYGDEEYLIEKAIATVCRRTQPILSQAYPERGQRIEGAGRSLEVRTFYAGEDSVEAIIAAWQTGPLFVSEQVVVLKAAEQLNAREQDTLLQALIERKGGTPVILCGHRPFDPSARLRAGSAQSRLGQHQKLFAYCAREGVAVEFRPLFASQISAWVQREAKEQGCSFTEEAASMLADLVGADLGALRHEIDKLCLFVEPKKRVGAADVAVVVGSVRTHSVFELADAVGRRNGRDALLILRRVLAEGESAIGLLGLLVSHLRRVWWGKEMLAQGKREEEVGAALRLWGGRLKAVVEQARLFSPFTLASVFARAADVDLALKSSRGDPRLLLEDFLLSLCAPAASKDSL